jgi:general secretion pathway protein D
VLIRTVVHLPNTDVRQLVNSLRTVQTQNQQYDSMINAGQSNAIILTGFGSNVAATVKLLLLIDQASRIDEGVEPIFDVLKLEFAAPEDVADIIEQLLEARSKATQDLRRNLPVPAEGGGSSGSRASTEAKILVDSRTSSLLIMAMPEDMPRIKDLVARLDVEVVEPERNYHIYNLSNVKAEELQKVLKDFLQDASRVTDSAGATGGRAPGSASGSGGSRGNEVVVIADAETNSLLIAASKTRYAEVLDLVRQLDKRQPQVLIETALIELTGDDARDIGIELGFADIPGVGDVGGVGVTSFGLSSFVDSDNDGIPDQKVPSILNGMTGGIIDGDDFALPVLLRLFQARTNTNVLNIPSVLVNNNGKAIVTTKDEQPTTTITATGVGGTTQENFNGYQEAGITLTISPSISASRYLRLNVSLSVSAFTGTFSGAIPPPRITRELQTEVNVPDGDTMVIGGIITDNQSETRESTPWLGDLPILGPLFRRDTNSNKRTTLYFFVTPHILEDEDFADLAEISYRKKLAAAEVMGKRRMDMVDPKFSGTGDTGLGGGFEIPLYRSPESGEVGSESVGLDAVRQSELLRDAKSSKAGAGAQDASAKSTPAGAVPAETEPANSASADPVAAPIPTTVPQNP